MPNNGISVQRLNYQHLYYFWQVARAGSITKASQKLGLAQPTISGQIAIFENSIGTQLFRKSGRNITLTEKGKEVFNYAEDIFSLGQQLIRALSGQKTERRKRISIGVSKSIDDLILSKLITPLCKENLNITVTTISEKKELISSDMIINGFDFVISDILPRGSERNKIYNSLLGISSLSIYANEDLAKKYGDQSPRSLKSAPFILPSFNLNSRRIINNWFEEKSLSPKIIAEIDDSDLMKRLAASGLGVIFSPTSVKFEILEQHKLILISEIKQLTNSYYLLHHEKEIEIPAIKEMIANSQIYLSV